MRHRLVLLAGGLMLLSAGAHGILGGRAVAGELQAAGVPDDLRAAIGFGWQWGTAAMIGFGTVVLIGGIRLAGGDRSGVAPIRAIAATYLVFGSFSCVALGVSPPMASFVVCGLLAGLPTIGPRRS